MKQFQHLEVVGDATKFDAFLAELNTAISPPWGTAASNLSGLLSKDTRPFSFVRDAKGGVPRATVILYQTPERCYVPNVLPDVRRQLTHAEYNDIVQDFARLVTPIAAKHGLNINIADSRFNIADHLSPASIELLDGFCINANRSVRHPSDLELWHDFIIQSFRDRCDASGVLARYIVEKHGWSDDEASELLQEYEFGFGLLERYTAP